MKATSAINEPVHRPVVAGWSLPTWLAMLLGASSIVWLLAASPAEYRPTEGPAFRRPSHQSLTAELLKREVDKVNDEIADSLELDAQAFLQKFVLIGAIIVALSGLKKEDARQVLDRLATRSGLTVALALAATVSLLVDAKMRANVITIDLKAQWLLQIEELVGGTFPLYEHYLRTPGNMHTDGLFRYIHWMQLSATTGLLYVGYLVCLIAPIDVPLQKKQTDQRQLHTWVFCVSQIALLIFALGAHCLPSRIHVLEYWPVPAKVLHEHPLVNVLVRWTPVALASALVWWRSPFRTTRPETSPEESAELTTKPVMAIDIHLHAESNPLLQPHEEQ